MAFVLSVLVPDLQPMAHEPLASIISATSGDLLEGAGILCQLGDFTLTASFCKRSDTTK
jgi:hypothetical protein